MNKQYSILAGQHLASVIVMCARVPLTHDLKPCQGLQERMLKLQLPHEKEKCRQFRATAVSKRLRWLSCEMFSLLLLPTTYSDTDL
jgi:hypothetical protein